MLGQLTKNLAQEYRSLKVASRELGRLSRGLREVEGGVVFGVGSLGATREAAEQLQLTAGMGQSSNASGEPPAPSTQPLSPHIKSRRSSTSRPANEGSEEPEGPATGSLNAADLLSPDLFKESTPPQQDDTTDA